MKSHFAEWALDLLLLCHNETIKFTFTLAITHSPIRTPEEYIVKLLLVVGILLTVRIVIGGSS